MTQSAIQHIFHSFAKAATLNLKMNLQQLRGTCQIFIFFVRNFSPCFCYFLPFAVKYCDLALFSPDDHPDSGRGFLFAAVCFCPPRARALFTLSRAGAGSWLVCRRRDGDVPAGPRETVLDSDTWVTLCLWWSEKLKRYQDAKPVVLWTVSTFWVADFFLYRTM